MSILPLGMSLDTLSLKNQNNVFWAAYCLVQTSLYVYIVFINRLAFIYLILQLVF